MGGLCWIFWMWKLYGMRKGRLDRVLWLCWNSVLVAHSGKITRLTRLFDNMYGTVILYTMLL